MVDLVRVADEMQPQAEAADKAVNKLCGAAQMFAVLSHDGAPNVAQARAEFEETKLELRNMLRSLLNIIAS